QDVEDRLVDDLGTAVKRAFHCRAAAEIVGEHLAVGATGITEEGKASQTRLDPAAIQPEGVLATSEDLFEYLFGIDRFVDPSHPDRPAPGAPALPEVRTRLRRGWQRCVCLRESDETAEVAEQLCPVLGCHRLGVKLHS